MNLERHRLILAVVEALNAAGSWSGKTHIQKAMALLLARARIEMPFEFVLYKHGPFSFELRDEIDFMKSYLGISSESVLGYGEKIEPGENKEFIVGRTRLPEGTLKEIRTVCDFVNGRRVADLERLATAAWIRSQENIEEAEQIAQRLHQLKPHISLDEARTACREVSQILQ